ncbi:hypothetical protein F3J20_19290 [Paraburkholderia sp. Cy-641]|uniref:hypothetical protein n=1 Tax=Paraburkholderia sp. Cy-641 TaxID=2608337 RepID=UPI00141F8F5E|nr:hypothetical protein [Paraburkholderia sp. Cy-641]NIF79508.1 hypothetical protein [Paraburkholderia sp. Cy-641]
MHQLDGSFREANWHKERHDSVLPPDNAVAAPWRIDVARSFYVMSRVANDIEEKKIREIR